MLIANLLGASLIATASLNFHASPAKVEQDAELRRAHQQVVHCVAAAMAAQSGGEVGQRLTNTILLCRKPAQALVDAYDERYRGGGEQFFMGPFLGLLENLFGKISPTAGH